MAEADDNAKPLSPDQSRKLGYGNVDARPDIDGTVDGGGKSEVDGQMNSGGESGGDAYPSAPSKGQTDKHGGQTEQNYSGSANPNSVKTDK